MFGDFQLGLQSRGSNRLAAWSIRVGVISLSPTVGIGVGTYVQVSRIVGGRVLAHNTFLQLVSEWGVVLTAILFSWAAVLLLREAQLDRFVPYCGRDETL